MLRRFAGAKYLNDHCVINRILTRHYMELKISPEEPLIDEKLKITISGLKPQQQITVKSSLTEGKSKFSSSACFLSDEEGNVKVHKQPSTLGTYTGVDGMGLFWSMIQDPGQQPGQRYLKRVVTTPQVVQFTVYDGHHSWNDCHNKPDLTPIITKDLHRWFMHKTVKREEIRHGNLRGTLFTPPGPGPFPGVIDMFGTAGGQIEYKAALMSSRGFITYALPYFNFEDLPKNMTDISFDYLKDTVDWFSTHPKVIKDGIGITGVSKGGEIALMLATKCPQVKSVVNINGTPFCSYSALGPFTDVVESDMSCFKFSEDGIIIKDALATNFSHEKLLKTWERDVKVLYIVGEDDQSVDPTYAKILHDNYPEDQRHKLVIKRYPNAGHLIEPPYSPTCRASFHKVFGVIFVWGGRTEDHVKAEEDSWPLILNFLKSTLEANIQGVLSSHL